MRLYENAKYHTFLVLINNGGESLTNYGLEFGEAKAVLNYLISWDGVSIEVYDDEKKIGTLTVALFSEIFGNVNIKNDPGYELETLLKYRVRERYHGLFKNRDFTFYNQRKGG